MVGIRKAEKSGYLSIRAHRLRLVAAYLMLYPDRAERLARDAGGALSDWKKLAGIEDKADDAYFRYYSAVEKFAATLGPWSLEPVKLVFESLVVDSLRLSADLIVAACWYIADNPGKLFVWPDRLTLTLMPYPGLSNPKEYQRYALDRARRLILEHMAQREKLCNEAKGELRAKRKMYHYLLAVLRIEGRSWRQILDYAAGEGYDLSTVQSAVNRVLRAAGLDSAQGYRIQVTKSG